MLLKEWLYRTGITYGRMCKDLKLGSRANLCRIANGRGPAGKKLALSIEQYTKGSVTRDEVMFPEKHPDFEKFRTMILPNKPQREEMKCKGF